MSDVNLPAHRAGLPEEKVSFILCPLTRLQGGACGARFGQVNVRRQNFHLGFEG
jgi:hypothetical protein